jgi:molybdopterin-guanine dinucleotide biosynthesis protein A
MNCYILVGGLSTRLGTSKAELFLDRILAAARPVFDEVLAVHRSDGAPLPVRTLFEREHDGDGPLFGIERALSDARDKAFILAVDFPLVTADFLRYVADAFEKSNALALVPEWDGKRQPLCGGYDTALVSMVEERLASGAYDVQGLLDEAAAEVLPESQLRTLFPGEPLLNVNTPEDLERLEANDGT